MPVVCLGINHRTAPIALRERLAFSDEDRNDLYSRVDLSDLERQTGLAELTVLSTCNRVEVYAAARDPQRHFRDVPETLASLLTRHRSFEPAVRASHLYAYREGEAVRHLSRVAAGLDSLVLGESEILGQVRIAHEQARVRRVSGPVLEAVFQTAISTGRRARAETAIGRMPVSVSSEAIRVAEGLVGSFAQQRVLIVGTGKMSRLGGRILRDKGVRHLSVISRTTRHAEDLAREWDAAPLGWHLLGDALVDADLVISSTGAPHPVITRELVEIALRRRHGRPILFVDIAVPRDVEDDVVGVPGVRVVNVDDLQAGVEEHLAERMRAIPRVERIVESGVSDFEEWRRQAEVRPLLAALRGRVEDVRQREVERIRARLGEVPPDLSEHLNRFSQSLANKLLHAPMQRLRDEADPRRRKLLQDAVRELFGLDDDEASRE